MPDRAAKFVSAIFVSALAGAALAGVTPGTARAADDCLAAPKGQTPSGSHWYYRIDRASKRNCWYLRSGDEALSRTVQPNPSAAATPAASVAPAPMQRSVADARAELPAQTNIERPKRREDSPFPAMPAGPALSQDNAAGTDTPPSVIASRWPDSSAEGSAVSPQPPATQLAANVQPASPQPDSPQSDSAQSDSVVAPPPAVALTAADSSQGLPASMRMLLAVMTGALALAGLTASLVLKFAGARRTARLRVSRERIWEPVNDGRLILPAHPGADVVPRRPLPRDLDQAREPGDRVADFYAQISKQARS